MLTLTIVIIGKEFFNEIKEMFELVDLNNIKTIKKGMLGNLNVLTYEFAVDEYDVLETRNRFLSEINKGRSRMKALFAAGDWMTIYIMKHIKEIRD